MPTRAAEGKSRRDLLPDGALPRWGTLVAVAVLALTVAACSSSGSGAAHAAGSRAVGAVALGPGCGRAPDPGPTGAATLGDVPQTLTVDGTARTYRLAVPSTYRARVPAPLIFQFHGSGTNAFQQSAYSGLPVAASAAGALVVTPDAIGGNWDLAAPGSRTADQRLVTTLEADLGARYCIDRNRIDAAGISLGSEFAAITACDPANRIAAVGLVAAEFLLRPCRGPIPVLAFHGTADPIVPYATGAIGRALPGLPVVGAVDNLTAWARLDGCRATPLVTTPAHDIVRRTWTACAPGGAATLYTVVGGGHTWPGSPVVLSAAIVGPTTDSISATHLMLAFFAAHPYRRT